MIPEKPHQLGQWFNWNGQGVNTTSIIVEELEGRLAVIPSAPRGTIGKAQANPKRKARSFVIPHYPHYDMIKATEVQGVRAFGSSSEFETVEAKLAEKYASMRDNHDVTEEFAKAGAISGILRDYDGSVIYDWHQEFKVSRNTHDIDFTDVSINLRDELIAAKRKGEKAIGGTLLYSGWKLVCTPTIFSAITSHPSIVAAYERWQDGAFLRADNRKGFMIADDIEVVSYHNNTVGDVEFIAEGESYLVPNSQNLFQSRFAPADTMEAANTIGLPLYMMSEPMPYGRGVDLATEQNAIYYAVLPKAIVRIKQK
ncbi:major capsid protein [Ochrobactrum sp. A-1]|nr:major capsid protein [Ochrobactrum sp. A-1]